MKHDKLRVIIYVIDVNQSHNDLKCVNFYCLLLLSIQGGKKKAVSRSAKALPAARKSRSRSRSPSKKAGSGKKKSKSLSPTPSKKPVDIMSPAAMSNAYYIAHGAPELLELRGFSWPGAGKKKKKKGGKKKKKK